MPNDQDQGAADRFADAARATLQTPQDQRERDLAEVIKQLETTAGAKDAPERAAFQKAQAGMGDQIMREPDPEKRAELRHEREAQGHEYAAGLADQIGGKVLGRGDLDDARDLHQLGELHREIAGALRTPPEKGPPERSSSEQTKADFARDAAAVSGLGPSAQTVHVEEVPVRPTAREALAEVRREAEQDREAAGPGPQRPEATLNRGVSVGVGPGGAVLVEINRDRPDVQPIAAGQAQDSQAAYDRSESGAREQRAELDAAHGVGEATPSAGPRQTAREALAEVRREAEQDREANGPERESGQGAARAGGRYATLGL